LSVLKVKVLREGCAPERKHKYDAGLDLKACTEKPFWLPVGARWAVPTGIKVAIEPGYVGIIKDRSGLALRHGIHVLAGVIDPGYRGEVKVVLVNLGSEAFKIEPGMRIAQLLVLPAVLDWEIVGELPPAPDGRGEGGFGSTGVE